MRELRSLCKTQDKPVYCKGDGIWEREKGDAQLRHAPFIRSMKGVSHRTELPNNNNEEGKSDETGNAVDHSLNAPWQAGDKNVHLDMTT